MSHLPFSLSPLYARYGSLSPSSALARRERYRRSPSRATYAPARPNESGDGVFLYRQRAHPYSRVASMSISRAGVSLLTLVTSRWRVTIRLSKKTISATAPVINAS